jgi:hypothetical protein
VINQTITTTDNPVLPVLGVVTLAAPGTITMNCGGFAIQTSFKKMFVVKVSAIING